MNKLILCEGVTDAILLSYYLEKSAGWVYSKKGPTGVAIKGQNQNESVNWYKNGNDYLLICGVGGKDNFGNFFESRIKRPLVDANAFEKLAIVTDRDDRAVEAIEEDMLASLGYFFTKVQDRIWNEQSYQDSYRMQKQIQVLLLAIPKEHAGALETVMLEAISEDSYDKNVVDKAGEFVQQMRSEAGNYIKTDRLQMKAHLGVTWAIQFPEKVFSLIHEQIRGVDWEKSEVLSQCFGMLCSI